MKNRKVLKQYISSPLSQSLHDPSTPDWCRENGVGVSRLRFLSATSFSLLLCEFLHGCSSFRNIPLLWHGAAADHLLQCHGSPPSPSVLGVHSVSYSFFAVPHFCLCSVFCPFLNTFSSILASGTSHAISQGC